MNKKLVSTAGIIIFTGSFLFNGVMAEKISTPITGWQGSFWNKPDGEDLSDNDGGVEITTDPEWVFDGEGALHVWTGASLPNLNAQAVQNISFEQGAEYRFTGKIYISSTSWGFGLYIGSDRLEMLRNLINAGEWADIDYTFTYQGSSSDFKLQAAQAGDLYADDLSLKKVLYDQSGTAAGYGEELLKNGDFESDFQSVGDVTELTAEAMDSGVILRWENPDDERLANIIIFNGEEILQSVDASQQSVEIDGLENGMTYTLTVKTETVSGILSDGCEVTFTPYREMELPKVIKDDKENRIIGITEEMEYSTDEGQTWIQYDPISPPELNGKITVWVRYISTEAGSYAPVQLLNFTENSNSGEQIKISKVKFEGNELVLEGVLNRQEEAKVTMYVIKQGADRRELAQILAIGQTVSSSDGSFTFRKAVAEYKNGQETDGFYDVYVDSSVTDEVKCESVAFASSANLQEAAEALLDRTDTAALLEPDSEYYNTYLAMGLSLDEYQLHPDRKSGIAADFKELLTELDPNSEDLINDICSAFARAYVINVLKDCDSEAAYQLLKDRLEYLDLAYGDITLDSVMNESAQELTLLLEYLSGKEYKNYEALNQCFAEGIALYEINQATYGILPDVLEKHKDVLDLNSSAYTSYASMSKDSSEKIEISKYIIEVKSRSPFKSGQDVLKAVQSAVNSGQGNGSSTGGSGGSGGSGGGSGGGASSSSDNRFSVVGSPGYIPSLSTPQPAEENNVAQEDTPVFPDIEGMNWAESSIEYLFQQGYIKGYEDGSFRPERPITREEFVSILVNALQITDEEAECNFEDVSKQDWFYKSVASAYSSEIVTGIDEYNFGTGKNITREELAALVYRCLVKKSQEIGSAQAQMEFTDATQISDYAREAVNELCGIGIITGYEDGSFLPKNTATRAEACVILHRMLTIMED